MSATVKTEKEIYLGGTRFPIIGKVRPSLISVLPGKVTIGEYSLADELVASNWVISDQRGGILVEEMDEATQQDRAYWSTCYLGSKGHIILPVLATDCGGGAATQPQVTYVGAGAGSTAFGVSITPAYPASLEHKDFLVLQVSIRDITSTPTVPSGWTALHNADSTGTGRQWLYYKFSDGGNESGTITVTHDGAAGIFMARIYAFRNVAISSFTEGGSYGTGTDTTIECPSLTTTSTKRLGVAFVYVSDDNTVGDFTGETGGDWEEATAELKHSAADGGTLQLQTATLATATTVSGGSLTMAADPWGVRVFALIPKANPLSSIDPYLLFDHNGVTYAFFGHYLQSFDNDNDDFEDSSKIFFANPIDWLVYKDAAIVTFNGDNIWQKGLPSLDKFIDNPYFKTWSAGYPVDWGFEVPADATVEQNTDTDFIHKGKFSVKMTSNAGGDAIYMRQKLPFSNVLRGLTVTVTAYGEEETAACNSYLRIKDGSGNTQTEFAGSFSQTTVAHTVAADATALELEIAHNEGAQASKLFYVDDIEISISGFSDWEDMRQAMKYLTSLGDHIYGVDGEGVFYESKVGIEYVEKCTIPDQFSVVNGLSTYRDSYGNLVPYVSTDVGDFAYDSENERLVRTELKLPSHPMGGIHPVQWREARYIPCGLDIRKYIAQSSASISEVGLNQDDGLPAEYQGEITGLYEGPNELFALVDSTYGSGTVYSSIMAYDTLGWQCKWLSPTAGKAIKCALLSSSYSEYRLFFGTNYKVYHIPIERNIRNPQKIPSFPFGASSVHITPWFDAGWIGDKLAKSLKLRLKGMSSTEKVTIYYRIDQEETDIDTGWTTLREIEDNGEFELNLPKGSNEGLVFESIQFKFYLERGGTNTNTPDILWAKLKFLKLLDTKWGWNVTLDCSKEYKDSSKAELIRKLKAIVAKKTLQEFTFRDDAGGKYTNFVKVSNAGGAEDTGHEWNGEFNLVLVEP